MKSQHMARILEALPPGTEVKVKGVNGIITMNVEKIEIKGGAHGLEAVIVCLGDPR